MALKLHILAMMESSLAEIGQTSHLRMRGVPPDALRILVLAEDASCVLRLTEAAERLGFSVHRVSSPSLALATIADENPLLFVIGEFGHDLKLDEICDALRIPRLVRPLGVLISDHHSLPADAIDEWDIDEILPERVSAVELEAILSQLSRVTWLQRRIIDRGNEILDSMPNSLLEVDHDLRIWNVNRAASELLGYGPENFRREILGRAVSSVLKFEGDRASVSSDGLAEGIHSALEAQLKRFRATEWIKNEERVLAVSITTLHEKNDHYLLELRDITEEEASAQLEAQRERLATIGNLAVGAAHEIQNPNTFNRVNAENLRQLFTALKPVIESSIDTDEAKIGTLPLSNVYSRIDEAISELRSRTYLPSATRMPWLLPRAKPSFFSFRMRRTSGKSRATMSPDPSSLPFSTTITSQVGFGASRSERRHAAKSSRVFQDGMTTESSMVTPPRLEHSFLRPRPYRAPRGDLPGARPSDAESLACAPAPPSPRARPAARSAG